MVFAALILSVAAGLQAQHGTAQNGYFPMGYAGDTWTGEVSAVNDASREITLVLQQWEKSRNVRRSFATGIQGEA
jgi:hypothetical protein